MNAKQTRILFSVYCGGGGDGIVNFLFPTVGVPCRTLNFAVGEVQLLVDLHLDDSNTPLRPRAW